MLENNIGPHYAPFYDTYAAALSEKGRVEEAIKLVERAMAQNAQPMKKLQLRLEALKQSQVQPTPSTLNTNATSSSKPTTTPSWEDEPVRTLLHTHTHSFLIIDLIEVLGDIETKSMMKAYSRDLHNFQCRTQLKDFIGNYEGPTPPEYKEVQIKLRDSWREKTLV